MKKFLNTAILLAMVTTFSIAAPPYQKEYLGLPGDNLNLYAVMKLFQESETLEGFERKLNDENSRVNNLDLNGDNMIDYIRVVDYVDKNVHNIVLRVAINKHEDQDVAVFTVQRFRNGQVQVQLIGDEALYGKNYIIEPIYDDQYANETPNPGYVGNQEVTTTIVRTTYYEVAEWPVVQFIYMPGYIAWHSSWYWGYYPPYWHPWRPYYWDFYYGYHYHWYNDYYRHYHHCDHYRYDHWNDFYYSSRRAYSPYVSHRIEAGHYQATYSRPDQRKHGEALYERTYKEQVNRRADTYQTTRSDRTDRRSGHQADQTRQKNGNSFSTDRRASTTMNRASAEIASTANPGAGRRSSNTFSNRAGTGNKTATMHRSETERRPAAIANPRSSGKPAASDNSFSERRSTTPRMDRQATTAKPAQSFSNSRSSGRPAARTESISNHRSSGQSQPARSSKSSEPRKAADNSKSDHRR